MVGFGRRRHHNAGLSPDELRQYIAELRAQRAAEAELLHERPDVGGASGYRPTGPLDPAGGHASPEPPEDTPGAHQGVPTPPRPWAGPWAPTEAELARWGSSQVLGTPDQVVLNPGTVFGPRVTLLDFAFPVPVFIATLVTGAPPTTPGLTWTNDIRVDVEIGVGRASTSLPFVLSAGTDLRVQSGQVPTRFVRVFAQYITTPAQPVIIAQQQVTLYAGFSLVSS